MRQVRLRYGRLSLARAEGEGVTLSFFLFVPTGALRFPAGCRHPPNHQRDDLFHREIGALKIPLGRRSHPYHIVEIARFSFTEVGAASRSREFSMETALPPVRTVTDLTRGVTDPDGYSSSAPDIAGVFPGSIASVGREAVSQHPSTFRDVRF